MLVSGTSVKVVLISIALMTLLFFLLVSDVDHAFRPLLGRIVVSLRAEPTSAELASTCVTVTQLGHLL